MPSPYATIEDSKQLWYEQSNYVATHIASMGYGLHIAIFSIATYYILQRRSETKRWTIWLVLNCALFVVGTINIACSINFNESAWINERNYPGGPFRFLIEQQALPVLTLGNSASILASFLADGLLLYRVMVLWDYTWYIIILPTLFYIACIILSILTVVQIAVPGVANAVNLSLPVWLVLMIINIVLSGMIATRILYMRRRIKSSLGDEFAKSYTMLATLVVEAALPFTILSIVLLVLFGGQNTAQNLFVPLLVQVECIAPELIIIRVILGNSWSNDRVSRPVTQSIRFASSSLPHAGEIEGSWMRPGFQGNSSGTVDTSVLDIAHSKEALGLPTITV